MEENIKQIKDDIENTFIQYCILYQEAMRDGNSKKANKYDAKLMQIIKNNANDIIEEIMVKLLYHDNDMVRLRAASFLLNLKGKLSKKHAIAVMKKIASMDNIESCLAELLLYDI